MASKNLKKLIRRIYQNAKEPDVSKRTLHANMYPVNFPRAVKYVNAQAKHLAFNTIFRPLYKEILVKDIAEYLAMGHKLNSQLRKEMKEYAKDKAKAQTEAQLAAPAAAKQNSKESENVLAEGQT